MYSDKEIQTRLRLLEIFTSVASKTGIEKGEVFGLAEKGFEFVTGVPALKESQKPSS